VKNTLLTGLLLLAGAAPAALAAGDDKSYVSHLMVDQEVVVASRIGGIVETIVVDRGAAVTQGQVLATLDPREADADVRVTKEEMELKKADFDRAQSLAASNVLSASDLDQKKAEYNVAVAQWEKAKTLRDYTVIHAPFTGIVTEKYARLGQKVIEDKNEPLFKITAVEPLLARVYLRVEALLRVTRGARVAVGAARFPDVRTTGEIQFISPSVDAGSGMFQVVIRVKRDPGRSVLRPGTSVKVRFPKPASR